MLVKPSGVRLNVGCWGGFTPPPCPTFAAGAAPALTAGAGLASGAGTFPASGAGAWGLGAAGGGPSFGASWGGGTLFVPSASSLLEGRAGAAALLGLDEARALPDIVEFGNCFETGKENIKSPSFSVIFQFAVK